MKFYSDTGSNLHSQLKYHSLHMLKGEVLAFVQSQVFSDAMKQAEDNVGVRADLLVKALGQFALDPTVGVVPEAFYMKGEEEIYFLVRFDRMVNFIGSVSLPLGGFQAEVVLNAIQANLRSRSFKAAKTHRRLDARAVRILSKVERLASEAYRKTYDQVQFTNAMTREERQRASLVAQEKAQAAYAEVYGPWAERIKSRIQRVAKVANPGARICYTETVAQFLFQHLPAIN